MNSQTRVKIVMVESDIEKIQILRGVGGGGIRGDWCMYACCMGSWTARYDWQSETDNREGK